MAFAAALSQRFVVGIGLLPKVGAPAQSDPCQRLLFQARCSQPKWKSGKSSRTLLLIAYTVPRPECITGKFRKAGAQTVSRQDFKRRCNSSMCTGLAPLGRLALLLLACTGPAASGLTSTLH